MSAFWFARTREIVPNHLLELGDDGRSTICRRLEMLPVEFVVHGYLAGSAWVDYQASGGSAAMLSRLASWSRTPAGADRDAGDKGRGGSRPRHQEAEAEALCGSEPYAAAREAALELYAFALAHAESRGIILADTKFEFGVDPTASSRSATRPSRPTPPGSGPATRTARAARSRPSTSSSCATTASRPGGIAPLPARGARGRRAGRAPATSRRSSG